MLPIFLTTSLLTQLQGAPENGDVQVLPERPSEPPCAVRYFADGIIACSCTGNLTNVFDVICAVLYEDW